MNKIIVESKTQETQTFKAHEFPEGKYGIIANWPSKAYIGDLVMMTKGTSPNERRLVLLKDGDYWKHDDLVKLKDRGCEVRLLRPDEKIIITEDGTK